MRLMMLFPCASVLLFAGGCTPSSNGTTGLSAIAAPTALERDERVTLAVQQAAPADLNGQWSWRNEEVLRMPPFVAALVGIQPEARTRRRGASRPEP
jgi:hypothetical protein